MSRIQTLQKITRGTIGLFRDAARNRQVSYWFGRVEIGPLEGCRQKPGPQLFTLDCGVPRGSGIATYAGNSWFAVPSAYVTQAPMLGKPSSVKPVDMKFSAGPCVLVLLVME